MADINKVWLSGIADSKPTLSRLPGRGLPFCWFTLLTREDFQSKGAPRAAYTHIRVEALGQQSDKVFDSVKEGQRYKVDGYLRMNEDGKLVVRTFSVVKDDSDEALSYEEGLRTALGVLMKSVDVKSAAEDLRLLLQPQKRG